MMLCLKMMAGYNNKFEVCSFSNGYVLFIRCDLLPEWQHVFAILAVTTLLIKTLEDRFLWHHYEVPLSLFLSFP